MLMRQTFCIQGVYKEKFETRWSLLKTTSLYDNSCCVRILINIIMVYVRAALIIKALEYELENRLEVALTHQHINN